MKFYIISGRKNGPWGGGNQFLKALKKELLRLNFYSESLNDAKVIIFNSYQDILYLLRSFFLQNKKKRIYRLGPIMSLHRKGIKWKIIDMVVILCANLFSDLVIFQSAWSFQQAKKRGFLKHKKYVIIHNAPDTSVFSKKEFIDKHKDEKVKLIYTSWSSNIKKGFNYLKFLDENLDFNKYEFTFIGNSPFVFKNIKTIQPVSSEILASYLRNNDIFISPIEDDACSNSLLEALSSGLPVVALKSGSNPELVKSSGILFSNQNELLDGIEVVAHNIKNYYDQIVIKSIQDITKEYIKATQII